MSDAAMRLLRDKDKTIIRLETQVKELRDALENIRLSCQCDRSSDGFNYGEDHPIKGRAKPGKRWLTPDEIAVAVLSKLKGERDER